MRDVRERINDAGAEIVIVGSGSPEQAGWFVEDFDIPMPVYSDPSLSVYKAVGAKKSWWSTLNPRVMLNSVRAMRGGFRQTKRRGVPNQQAESLSFAPMAACPMPTSAVKPATTPIPPTLQPPLKPQAVASSTRQEQPGCPRTNQRHTRTP